MKKIIIIIFILAILLMVTTTIMATAETTLPNSSGSVNDSFNLNSNFTKDYRYIESSDKSYKVINNYRHWVFPLSRPYQSTLQFNQSNGNAKENLEVWVAIVDSNYKGKEKTNTAYGYSCTAKATSSAAYIHKYLMTQAEAKKSGSTNFDYTFIYTD